MRIRQLINNTEFCLLALLTYCVLYNLYIYELTCTKGQLSYRETKLIKEYANLFITAVGVFNLVFPKPESYLKQSAILCILAVCWNYVLNIFIQHDFINQMDAPYYFLSFNGVVVAITIAVTWEGIKYGIFKINE